MANIDDDFNAKTVVKVKPSREDILAALKFGDPKEVNTKIGLRITREAKPSQEFFDLWTIDGASLREAGYTLGRWPKETGPWKVTKWEKVPEKILIQRQEAKAMSRATDADINAPIPDGLSYLGYQRAGIAFGFERPGVLFGDEMGLGKTIQAIGILNCMLAATAEPRLKVLVVCPASLKLNWQRELTKWTVKRIPIFVADSKMCPDMFGVVIINYDILHKHEDVIHGIEYDLVICDEAHYLKAGQKSRRGKMVFGVKPTAKQVAAGVTDVPGIRAKKKLLLTGTPIANRPMELFPLINYLDPLRWNNFFRFGIRYCGGNKDGGHWDFTGSSNLEELQDILRSTIMVRRLKKDVLKELPPKRRQVIELAAEGETARLVKAERQAFEGKDDEIAQLEAAVELAKADDNEDAYRSAVDSLKKGIGAAFGEIATLRRNTAVAKIPQVIEHLRDALDENDDAIVVMCHHHEVSSALMKEFGDLAVLHRGDMDMAAKDAAVTRFQGTKDVQADPTCRLFIGSIQASGVGITLTRAAHVVFAELDWVPGNVSQAEDRCHRIGQDESVLIQHLVLEGSLDAVMAKRIISKQEVIERALDVQVEAQMIKNTGATEGMKRERIAAEAATITPEQKNAAHAAIKFIAARCNGARDWDGAGFSKIDTAIGKSFAAQEYLTNKQAVIALKIARKYRGQLGEQMAMALT